MYMSGSFAIVNVKCVPVKQVLHGASIHDDIWTICRAAYSCCEEITCINTNYIYLTTSMKSNYIF